MLGKLLVLFLIVTTGALGYSTGFQAGLEDRDARPQPASPAQETLRHKILSKGADDHDSADWTEALHERFLRECSGN
jgi:hypothetical protein